MVCTTEPLVACAVVTMLIDLVVGMFVVDSMTWVVGTTASVCSVATVDGGPFSVVGSPAFVEGPPASVEGPPASVEGPTASVERPPASVEGSAVLQK